MGHRISFSARETHSTIDNTYKLLKKLEHRLPRGALFKQKIKFEKNTLQILHAEIAAISSATSQNLRRETINPISHYYYCDRMLRRFWQTNWFQETSQNVKDSSLRNIFITCLCPCFLWLSWNFRDLENRWSLETDNSLLGNDTKWRRAFEWRASWRRRF